MPVAAAQCKAVCLIQCTPGVVSINVRSQAECRAVRPSLSARVGSAETLSSSSSIRCRLVTYSRVRAAARAMLWAAARGPAEAAIPMATVGEPAAAEVLALAAAGCWATTTEEAAGVRGWRRLRQWRMPATLHGSLAWRRTCSRASSGGVAPVVARAPRWRASAIGRDPEFLDRMDRARMCVSAAESSSCACRVNVAVSDLSPHLPSPV